MVALSVILGLAALHICFAVSASNAVCSKEPYKALLVLSAFPAAESFCSSKFPLSTCTSILTSTVTSVIQTATTVTAATVETTVSTTLSTTTTGTTTSDSTTSTTFTDTTLQNTVTTISSTTTTGTTTTDFYTTTTVIDTTTITDDVITSTTTTTTTNPAKKRHAEVTQATTLTTVGKRSNPLLSLLSSLESEAKSVIQTACSCIEAIPPCITTTATTTVSSTTTNTISATATDSVTATSVVDVEQSAFSTTTTTIVATATNSLTATNIVDIEQTVTSSITETDSTTVTSQTTQLIATTTTTTACASVAVPSNGNFDSGSLSPWTKEASSTVSESIVAGGFPASSKYYLQAGPMSNSDRFEIYQSLTTCAGVTYSCSYSWRYSDFVDVSNHVPFVSVAINDDEVDQTDFDSDTAGIWNTDTFDFTGTGNDIIYVAAESPGSTINTLGLDSFVCTQK